MVPAKFKIPATSVLHTVLPHIFNTISRVGFDESRETVNQITKDISCATSVHAQWYDTYLAVGHAVLGLSVTLTCDIIEEYSLNLIRNAAYDRNYILAGNDLNLSANEYVANLTYYKLARFDKAGLLRLKETPVVYRCPDTGEKHHKNWYSEPVLRIIYKFGDMAKLVHNTVGAPYGTYGVVFEYIKNREQRNLKYIKPETVVRYLNYNHNDKHKHRTAPPIDFILFLGRLINDRTKSLIKQKPARASAYI